MTRFIFSVLCLILVFPSLSEARGSVKVGDKIPHNLNLKDQHGKDRSFSNLVGEKGMVLTFIRSVEWCPYCQKQVIGLNKNRKKFSDMGYSVVTVSYDQVEHMKKFVTKNNPKITLLSDPASDSIRAFDILNKNSAKGTMSYGIPHPGVYIIDKDKKVQAKFFKKGKENRATISELTSKIEALNTPEEPPMTIESMGQDPIPEEEQFVKTPQETLPSVLPEVAPVDVAVPELATESPENIIEEAPIVPLNEVKSDVEANVEVDTTTVIIEEPSEILEEVKGDALKIMSEEVINSEEIIEIP